MITVNDIPTGALFTTSTKSAISKGIIWFEEMMYKDYDYVANHIGLFVRKSPANLLIRESDGTRVWVKLGYSDKPGVTEIPFFDYFKGKPDCDMVVIIPPKKWRPTQKAIFAEFTRLQLGKGYDFEALPYQAIRFIRFKLTGIDRYGGIKTPLEAMEDWYCSELGGCAINEVLHINPFWQKQTPMGLMLMLWTMGWDFYKYNERLEQFVKFEIKIK